MADSTLTCSIVTPEAAQDDVQITAAVLPAHDGEVGILPGHAPMLCNLGAGIFRYKVAGGSEEKFLFIEGGVSHVKGAVLTVLTKEAKHRDEVTSEYAKGEFDKAFSLPKSTAEEVASRNKALTRARSLQAFSQG